MNNTHHDFNVARLSILAGMLSLASLYLTAAGAGFNTAVFSNPRLLLGMTTANVQLLKWSMFADMFGFYLLLLPAVFYFHHYLKKRSSWSYLITWCGSAYILTGAIGAAILAVVWPAYIVEYPIASALQQELIARNFDLVNQMIYGGMWNTLEVVFAATWWLGVGLFTRNDHPFFGTLSIVLGLACLLDAAGNMTDIKPVAEIGLNIYLLLGIVWPVWFGAWLLLKKDPATYPANPTFSTKTIGVKLDC